MIRARWIGSPKVLLLSVLLLLMGGASAALRGEDKPPLCRIDRIDGAMASGGFLEVTGFAVDPERETPVQKLEVLLDGALVGETTLSGLRPDVASHFHRQGYLWSGWSASTSLERVSAGKHVIQVKAIAPSGIKASCGIREVEVLAVPSVPSPPAWRIGAVILMRTLVFLLWLGLVGWFPARILGRPIVLLAPLLGLALFAIFAETGAALKVRPIISALTLTAVSGLALLVSTLVRRIRLRRPSRTVALTFVCCVFFAGIGVIPLASHGEDAVLGNIDDAIRECTVADSISRFGWRVPPDIHGYLAAIPATMNDAHIRLGGSYLLSALGEAFDVRAHAVFSVAMLAIGTLIILATGLLAFRVLRPFPAGRWIAPALVALNSVLLATLYGQHFGNLLSVALFTAFLSQVLVLLQSPRARSVWPVAVIASAAFSLYPETTPVWGAAALLTLGAAGAGRRVRSVRRLAIAALLAAVLNPIGLARAAEFFGRMTSHKPSPQSLGMSSPYNRLMTGDTHYFPRLTVLVGLEAYRDDAPAPVGTERRILIPAASILILANALLGWARLAVRERWMVAALVFPAAGALAWMYGLSFPYGFARLLPLAVPVWLTAFVLLACRAAEQPDRSRLSIRRLVSCATLVLVAALTLPAARHVMVRARRSIPAYDPDFRVLPDMAAARIRRDSVIEIDEPLVARREWMRYFLGEWETEVAPSTPEPKPLRSERRHYLLLDRRRPDQAKRITGSVALDFALVPVASTLVPAR